MSAGEKITLFTALPVSRHLSAQSEKLPRRGIDARWVHPEDLHITLRYLGPVETRHVDDIERALESVRCKSFNLDVEGLSLFRQKKQTVLYAPVKSTRKLTHLCAEVTDALTPLGFDFGTRPYMPHITLARLKKSAGASLFTTLHSDKINAKWKPEEFCLMRSATPEEGQKRYTVLSAFKLPEF